MKELEMIAIKLSKNGLNNLKLFYAFSNWKHNYIVKDMDNKYRWECGPTKSKGFNTKEECLQSMLIHFCNNLNINNIIEQ